MISDLAAEYVSGKLRAGGDAGDARWAAPRRPENQEAAQKSENPLLQRVLCYKDVVCEFVQAAFFLISATGRR